jgi:hypothetical protein
MFLVLSIRGFYFNIVNNSNLEVKIIIIIASRSKQLRCHDIQFSQKATPSVAVFLSFNKLYTTIHDSSFAYFMSEGEINTFLIYLLCNMHVSVLEEYFPSIRTDVIPSPLPTLTTYTSSYYKHSCCSMSSFSTRSELLSSES